MSEEERNGEFERARRIREAREEEEEREGAILPIETTPTEAPKKKFQCPTCGTGFGTKGNMFKHIRTFHSGEKRTEINSSTRREGMEEEPVTFETFKKYFDTEAVERDPQNFFSQPELSSPSPPSPVSVYSGRQGAKTRFTPHQRDVLLTSFHRSL